MRLDPLSIILDQDFKPNKKFFFISGNEKTLMEKIYTRIVDKIKDNENVIISSIDAIVNYVDEESLFEDKKIVLIKGSKEINEDSLNNVRNSNSIFIFSQENSQKIKKIKKIFLNDKDSYLIDCYELDKNTKIKILNQFIKMYNLNMSEDVYWFLVEKLDNKYALMENSLNKILGLKNEDVTLFNIKKLLTVDSSGKERLFFSLYKKNKQLIEAYRDKVITASDVNDFYYYCKSFCQLIIDSVNEDEYVKKIPVYLFKEKSFLIDVYRKYNPRKKEMLISLLSSTEKILRKESDLSLITGLRFLLSVKKITIS